MKRLARIIVAFTLCFIMSLSMFGCSITLGGDESSSAKESSSKSKMSASMVVSSDDEEQSSTSLSPSVGVEGSSSSFDITSEENSSSEEEISTSETSSISSKSSSSPSVSKSSSSKSSSSKSSSSSSVSKSSSSSSVSKSSSSKSSSSKSSSSSSKSSSSSSKSSSSSSKSSSSSSKSSSSKSSSTKSSSSSSSSSVSSSSSSSSSVPSASTLISYEALSESAYIIWADSNISSAKAYYKLSSSSSYTQIDAELVRNTSKGARADFLGLKAGTYDFKVDVGSSNDDIVITGVNVGAYDRSGYAHFGYTAGVGAYKDDGTLKSGVSVVYITEANKNSTGIVKSIQKGNVCVRIIGKVSCPQYLSSNKLDTSITDITGIARKNLGDDSYWNMIDVSEKSNITIEGVGDDAEFYQFGLTFKKCNSIEVRNLTFTSYPEDACSFEGSSGSESKYKNYWIHNCQFNVGKNGWDLTSEKDKGQGDGATDIKHCSNVTFSYNVYNGCKKTMLCGGSDSHLQYNVTLHHNYYKSNNARLPLARAANIHIYNCYYESNATCMSLRANAYIFSEANYYKSNSKLTDSNTKFNAKSYNDKFVSTSTTSYFKVVTSRDAKVANSNKYGDFDTSTTNFYYDSSKKVSNVSYLTDADTAMADVKSAAGPAKANLGFAVGGGSASSGSSSSGGSGSSGSNSNSSTSSGSNSNSSSSSSSQGGATGEYQEVYSENFDNYSGGFSTTESDSQPYYTLDGSASSANGVKIEGGECVVYDTSTSVKTTFVMPIKASSGEYKIELDITPSTASSKWTLVEFTGTNVVLRTDADKKISGSVNGGTTLTPSSTVLSAGTKYHVTAIFNFDNDTVTLKLGSTTILNNESFSGSALESLTFVTSTGSARNINIDNVVVYKKQ